jgi:4-hydroxy-tetrahydrodipicolinate reductase
MTIKVIVNGAGGKMGQEVVKLIQKSPDFELVATPSRNSNLENEIQAHQAQIVIDFTTAAVAYQNCAAIINSGAHPVIGTTGFSSEQIQELQQRCAAKKLGGIIAPNFAIGVILLMRCAKEVVQYFPHVEIIELHHDGKADAPSGTAIKTAEVLGSVRQKPTAIIQEKELLPGARGSVKNDIHIHSVRLPGLVAHEEIIFGGLGQSLTLRHDTYHREAFMPGVLLACQKVLELDHLVYGLENIL